MKRAKPSASNYRASGAAAGAKEPTAREELALFAERFMHFMNVWTV
jgi:hypothetical protein